MTTVGIITRKPTESGPSPIPEHYLMVATIFLSHNTRPYNHNSVSAVCADSLEHIWRQGIYDNSGDVGGSVPLRLSQRNTNIHDNLMAKTTKLITTKYYLKQIALWNSFQQIRHQSDQPTSSYLAFVLYTWLLICVPVLYIYRDCTLWKINAVYSCYKMICDSPLIELERQQGCCMPNHVCTWF